MPPLATDLRRQLENVVVQARDLAEAAARAALKRWAVDAAEPFEHFSAWDKVFRKRLRARGRQAGDRRDERKGIQEIDRLTEELAYEYWHRMLFARFLAENHLLMHPDGVAVTLEECEELALSEKAANGFVLAARYASRMLPEIFRTDDVLLEVEFPINDRLPLERKLAELPAQVFIADDSLGWVYQFWQARKKGEVDKAVKSGQKIDGWNLSAVTQLFTEHYMVEFLLHNTIGAWWCSRHGTTGPPGGAGVPEARCPVRLDYLRWKDDGTPAAGAFEGWPRTLKEFTMLDPCCGSGHFLVAGFHLLVPLRMHDEGLSAREAVDAVLRENLHGLELDSRCTQIAAFALALAAWKYPGEDGRPLGFRPLPPMKIACSGQGVVGTKEDWTRFANGDARFREGMVRLYDLFQKAPALGSLIDPRAVADDLFALGFDTLKGTLDRTLKKLEAQADPDRAAVGVAAQGIALAAAMMARGFTLVATNVPYLARGKQAEALRDYIAEVYPFSKADLATAFVERAIEYCAHGGSTALVTPQNWLFLGSYKTLRERLLRQVTWHVVAKLGPAAFEDMNWWAANTMLSVLTTSSPTERCRLLGFDASSTRVVSDKPLLLKEGAPLVSKQSDQLTNPDCKITLECHSTTSRIRDYAVAQAGILNGDSPRFRRNFWEIPALDQRWERIQSTLDCSAPYGGREGIILWEHGQGQLRSLAMELRERLHDADRRGNQLWGKRGILVSAMNRLPVTIYSGNLFDNNTFALCPHDQADLLPLWTYCSSPEFLRAIRQYNQKTSIEPADILRVCSKRGELSIMEYETLTISNGYHRRPMGRLEARDPRAPTRRAAPQDRYARGR